MRRKFFPYDFYKKRNDQNYYLLYICNNNKINDKFVKIFCHLISIIFFKIIIIIIIINTYEKKKMRRDYFQSKLILRDLPVTK